MFAKLTQWEERLCAAVEDGLPARFPDGGKAAIRAEVLRRLLLGLKLTSTCAAPRRLADAGVVIHNARIKGRLDLDNTTGSGGAPLPALVLETCRLDGGLSARHAHLGRLSLNDSTLSDPGLETATLDLTGSQIDSDLTLRNVRPAEEDGLLWVSGARARIDGTLDVCGAVLKAPQNAVDRPIQTARKAALMLSGSEIAGDVFAMARFRAEGGVYMQECRIRGSIWMGGATLDGRGDNALDAQSAVIDGNLMLTAFPERDNETATLRFRAQGPVWLMGARIGGSLEMGEVELSAPGGYAIVMASITIGDRLRINGGNGGRARIRGRVDARSAVIGAVAHFDGVHIGDDVTPDSQGIVIDLENARIEQDLLFYLDPIRAETPDGAAPAGPLKPQGQAASLNNSLRLVNAKVGALEFVSTRIQGVVDASGLRCAGDAKLALAVTGKADFSNIIVNGSLDLTGFTFGAVDSAAPAHHLHHLSLKDGHIDRALKIAEPPKREHQRQARLHEARETPLACYPGWRLVEALWDEAKDLKPDEFGQSMHLLHKDGRIRTLGGQSLDFHVLNGEGALRLDTPAQAEEYARLFCGVVRGDEGTFQIIDALPKGAAVDIEALDAERRAVEAEIAALETRLETVDDDQRETLAAELETARARLAANAAARTFDLSTLPATLFQTRAVQERDADGQAFFLITTVINFGKVVFKSRLKVDRSGAIEMIEDTPVTPALTKAVPEPRGRLLVRRQVDEAAPAPAWPQTALLPGAALANPKRRAGLADLLRPEITDGAGLFNAAIDLADLSCGTLEDNGGPGWGRDVMLTLDRLTYRQAMFPQPDETRRWYSNFLRWLIRLGAPVLSLLNRINPTGPWLSRLDNAKSPWERRRDWLDLQYDRKPGRTTPSHHVSPDAYKPQPYAEIIRVSRVMGDEEAATEFEILKHRIEARNFAIQSRPGFMALGLFGGLVTGFALWLGTEASAPAAIAAGIGAAVLLSFLSTIADWMFRVMFGYLRKPIQALLTILVFFSIGWLGVHAANRSQRLVIDVTPVASVLVERGGGDGVVIGSPLVKDLAEGNVACGREISEPLYALDVFVPLIDLRQESRCEVGAPDRDHYTPIFPRWEKAEAVAARALRSTTFWDVAKAIYAVAGWIIISLSILTFAQVARRREEANG